MNPFYNRFRNKTEKELQLIIENQADYTEEAIEAAKHILRLEEFKKEEELKEERRIKYKKRSASGAEQIKEYLSGFNKGQLFTLISLTLFYWSIFECFYLYSNERSFGTFFYPALLALLPLIFILNHVFFRVEKKRNNTYWGRVISTLFLLVLMILFRVSYQIHVDGDTNYSFDFFGFTGVVFALFLFSVSFELLISLINFFLKTIKCQHL